MKTFVVLLWLVFFAVSQVPYRTALPSTVLVFLWSPHQIEMKEVVSYRILSQRGLAKFVVSEES